MAYHDALFQLGMDLTRSSTAQKEDHGPTAPVARTKTALKSVERETADRIKERTDYFIERDGVKYAGNHLLIDVFGGTKLDDLRHIEATMRRCVEVAGATLLHIHLHHFTPNGGVSGVAVLSESHISVHSWPEANFAAFDVFMCGEAKPELCVNVLREAFAARDVVVKTFKRGEELAALEWQAARKPQPAAASRPSKQRVRKAA